jgi:hypothetical protein
MTTSAAKANRNADIVNRLEAENERLRAEKEMFRKAADADGFHRVLAVREAEIERLREELELAYREIRAMRVARTLDEQTMEQGK